MNQQNIKDLHRYIQIMDRELFPNKSISVFTVNQRLASSKNALASYQPDRPVESRSKRILRKLLAVPLLPTALLLTLTLMTVASILYQLGILKSYRGIIKSYYILISSGRKIQLGWKTNYYRVTNKSDNTLTSLAEIIGFAAHEVRHRIQDTNCFMYQAGEFETVPFLLYQEGLKDIFKKQYPSGDVLEKLRESDSWFIQFRFKTLAQQKFSHETITDDQFIAFVRENKKLLLTRFTNPSENFF